MATVQEKLAASLEKLNKLQQDRRRVFQSKELSRLDRERLLAQGFVRELVKGWLISASPGTQDGDSTPWYASFWEFCARYSSMRFGKEWHLSPEQSLLLHGESTVIPQQVVVYSPKGTNNTLKLPFGNSLYDLRQAQMPRAELLTQKDGLNLFNPAAALTRANPDFFTRYPLDVQVALGGVKDASAMLSILLEGGHAVVAGRIAGAFRRVGRSEIADEIIGAMRSAGYDIREADPFAPQQTVRPLPIGVAPIVGRLKALWAASREPVIQAFAPAPGLPRDTKAYLTNVDEIYRSDAYHSLSIEGYSVSTDLIERVRSGKWRPEDNEADRRNRDALAARGYWQAFQQVRGSVSQIIGGSSPGALVRSTHRGWYREMFQPCVTAGLIQPTALAGYRGHPVYIRGSRHVPTRWEVLPDAMTALFDLLEVESEPAVRAVLGHWLFGYIHPYSDGNGRMARFVMNAMLASGGYPWTVIKVEDRDAYMGALESASVGEDIRPFAEFLAKRVRESMSNAVNADRRMTPIGSNWGPQTN